MKKILLCSHESDADGIGAVVLGKLAFKNLDYKLFHNPDDLELNFRNMLANGELDIYDMIYITDLSLHEPAVSMVNNSLIKDKILIFDHHQRAIDLGLRKYPFFTIIEEDESGKRCGTELFYRYLVDNGLLDNKNSIETFVEYTREEDTWDWKNKGEDGVYAHMLGILFGIFGRDKYLDVMYNKINNNDEFSYTDDELKLVSDKKREFTLEIKRLLDDMEVFIDEDDNRFGAVFSPYQYRNEIPEYIIDSDNSWNIKYIVIVAMDKGDYGQKSYRRIDDDIDCNKIVSKYGGGGHVATAAVGITKKQNDKMKNMSKKEALAYIVNESYTKE